MIEFEEAYKIVIGSSYTTGTEAISFSDSLNRVLAMDIASDMDIPPFDRATVDGFACRKKELENPLEIIEILPAGVRPTKAVLNGQCAKIMTGAPVPDGADMVFMVEDSLILPDGKVRYTGSSLKENISYRGEDIKTGDIVLRSGKQVQPQDIAVMASAGCTEVLVGKMPVVSIISSGDELVEPQEKPGVSNIRNSNAYQLMAQVERAGAIAKYMGIAGDDEDETCRMIKDAVAGSDMVMITGGVSMGDFDFVPSVMERAGISILFSSVRVQPGKPTTFGIHPKVPVFGLPGNPVSSFIQFELLVRPLICKMMGCIYRPFTFRLKMKESFSRKTSDRQAFIPVRITDDEYVKPVEYHGSAHISALTQADGIISIPAGKADIKQYETVSVRQI
jgi:molybdopterin molybdotransferase